MISDTTKFIVRIAITLTIEILIIVARVDVMDFYLCIYSIVLRPFFERCFIKNSVRREPSLLLDPALSFGSSIVRRMLSWLCVYIDTSVSYVAQGPFIILVPSYANNVFPLGDSGCTIRSWGSLCSRNR